MEVDNAPPTPANTAVVRSTPYVVNTKLTQPSDYNFRRHFVSTGRYFYRLHGKNVPTFSRIDSLNGDVLLYTPVDVDEYHKQIQQLHYFKPISDTVGILVYLHGSEETAIHHLEVHFAIISICHVTQKFTVLSKDEFRWFPASTITQATLAQNANDPHQMLCVVTDSTIGSRDRSCIVFFEVVHAKVSIRRILIQPQAFYFPNWNGQYIEGVFEDEMDETSHNLQRLDIHTQRVETVAEKLLQFLEPNEYVSDFCWHRDNVFMFVLSQNYSTVYIQKFDLIRRKFMRINFPIEEYASVSKISRFYISTDSVICYCETKDDGEWQTDRFFRIPMRCPDKLLNYAWIAVRDFFESNQISLPLPKNFAYLSPIRQILKFEKPPVPEIELKQEGQVENSDEQQNNNGDNSNNASNSGEDNSFKQFL